MFALHMALPSITLTVACTNEEAEDRMLRKEPCERSKVSYGGLSRSTDLYF